MNSDIPNDNIVIDGIYIDALANAIQQFHGTEQNITKFVVFFAEQEDGLIKITFAPKPVPGKKFLGGGNENGYTVHYLADKKTGEIVRTFLAR